MESTKTYESEFMVVEGNIWSEVARELLTFHWYSLMGLKFCCEMVINYIC